MQWALNSICCWLSFVGCSLLTGLFTEDQVPWLLEMLRNDVFGGAEKISRDHFMTIRGHSPDKNAFWRQVSQIAVEKFNMQEVFNMRSTVRLTAIEKLCECVSCSLWWSLPFCWLADCHNCRVYFWESSV